MFEVKFGTPKPVTFREYRKYGNQVMDIDLDVRFAGRCEVLEYDNSRYANDEEVSAFIKQNCSEILERCLKNWPEGESVMKSYFNGLDGSFSTELKNSGITAKSEIDLKKLTEDSETLYKEILRTVTEQQTDCGWDHMNDDPAVSKPEGTYMVSPVSMVLKHKDDRVFYKPGERVDVVFWAVGSDTSYQVTVNAPDLKVDYGNVINISFTMPEHDVFISVGSRSAMTCLPDDTGKIGFTGFRGINVGDTGNSVETPKPDIVYKEIISDGFEWTCPLCGSKNTGKFCPECGGVRPSQPLN